MVRYNRDDDIAPCWPFGRSNHHFHEARNSLRNSITIWFHDSSRQMKLIQHTSPLVWSGAGVVSLVLFGVVVAQLDESSLAAAAGAVSWTLLGTGVALFVAESLFGAVRMHLIAGRHGGFPAAIRVTAWHAIWLIVLPMRLGEVAWVISMRRAYGWNVATAAACALVQRLLDVVVITVFLILTIPVAFGLHEGRMLVFSIIAIVLCLIAVIGCTTLHVWLRLAAKVAVGTGRPRGRRRRFLRHLSQARRWFEDVRHRRTLRRCIVPTILNWMTVFTAYWILGRAVGLDISLAESGFAAAGSTLITAVPVQSIGGFGLLEAGFTGIVAWFGAPAGLAALAALAIRFASLAATGLFWLFAAILAAMPSTKEVVKESP